MKRAQSFTFENRVEVPWGFKHALPPSVLRALRNLPPELRDRAVTRWRTELLPREEEARRRLRAQARLLEDRLRAEREEVRQDEREAYALLSAGAPLGGYARLARARDRARHRGLEPASPDAYAEAVLARRGGLEVLPPQAREVARALVLVALEVGLARGYHARTAEVAFHLPQQVLAAALWPEARPETARKRVQRALARLAEAGLLAYRGRVGNARDRATGRRLGWRDGTVFRVRLVPGRAAPVRAEELAHPWRDLEADIRRGRTARRRLSTPMSQTRNIKGKDSLVEMLLGWALAPVLKSKAPLSVWDTASEPPRVRLRNAVMDVRAAERPLRRDLVESAARLAAHLLADPGSVRFYAALFWGALRLHDRGGDPFPALAAELERALVDREEGFARRAGALLTARLRASGLLAQLLHAPPYRVA